ncbi:hypothetical protein PtA15_8A208 [Puccinia triticina]|uniref:Uncharacterized protein n=1 Tax=Puccinia triticina TaxID=208348 RepID=A0ABY7CQ32_9BASI|nr:uncharacterized protein PtA15_8A208 [Puccinia triticina]WAQ87304.1 hypothetical protein PtA15_8A208 [Puccinia triticina]
MLSMKIFLLLTALVLQGQAVYSKQEFFAFKCSSKRPNPYCSQQTFKNGAVTSASLQLPLAPPKQPGHRQEYICSNVADPNAAILNQCCSARYQPSTAAPGLHMIDTSLDYTLIPPFHITVLLHYTLLPLLNGFRNVYKAESRKLAY